MLSIVIPVLNERGTIELLLRCLEAQTCQRERFECLIVDDGSKDGTVELLRGYQAGFPLRVLEHPQNRGRAHARNTGWRASTGSAVLFLDADVLPAPDWLADYATALERSDAGVVSGGRHHLDLSAQPGEPAATLARWAATTPDRLFREDATAHTAALARRARPSPYPSRAAEKAERELRQVCEQHPGSLLCAYSLVTANVAVRRHLLEEVHGFDGSMGRGEDTELGIRLWQHGVRFTFAPGADAYHVYRGSVGIAGNGLGDRLAFFYRQPYRLVYLVLLWFYYHSQENPVVPVPFFESLTALAAAGPHTLDFDLATEVMKTVRQPLPASCVYDRDLMIAMLHEETGIPQDQVGELLDRAVAEGLIAERREGRTCFDPHHTGNWLRRCTLFRQYELQGSCYPWFRDWIPSGVLPRCRAPSEAAREAAAPRASGGPKEERPALLLRCRGTYEVTVPPALLEELGGACELNIPLPVEHAAQSEVRIGACEPPDLLDYANPQRRMILAYPLSPRGAEPLTLRYAFECLVREAAPCAGVREAETAAELARFLAPTYVPALQARIQALLDRIFTRPVDDPLTAARAIYGWMLENMIFLRSFLPDSLMLQAGVGSCVQLARLFVSLCRTMRIPARDQCGAMFGRRIEPGAPLTVESTLRSISPFAHTWAEFHVPGRGWLPVEFTGWALEAHQLTPRNVADPQVRAQLTREGRFYNHEYYFGHLDPLRIYADALCSKVPTYPVARGATSWKPLTPTTALTRHRLVCQATPVGG
jgi:glycosyltransferase involved in cell wall biosynthesis